MNDETIIKKYILRLFEQRHSQLLSLINCSTKIRVDMVKLVAYIIAEDLGLSDKIILIESCLLQFAQENEWQRDRSKVLKFSFD